MSATTDMAERHGRVLAALAEVGLSLARELAARAKAAQTDEAAQSLGLAFQRISRSVRLCVALEAKLERERLSGWREARAQAAHITETRKARVRAVLTRAVYDETESCEAESLLDDLEARLGEEALCETFAAEPVEACIARIRAGLGLPPEEGAGDPASIPQPRIALSG